MTTEEALIRRIRESVESVPKWNRHLLRGIGDDAAILDTFGGNLAVTTDMLCDGIDFRCGKDSPEEIGRKSLAVNLSDLAAIGAIPLAVLFSVVFPLDAAERIGSVAEFAERFFDGMAPLVRRYSVAIAGGDTNAWHGAFAVSVTALGAVEPHRALLRSGARPGDRVMITGRVGGSIFRRQFRFFPRIVEALYLARYHEIHAAIDISDGLEIDLSRLARESSVRARLEPDRVPIHPDALTPPRNAREFPGWKEEKTPLEHALSDGEDFELILAVPPAEAARLVAEQPFSAAARGEGPFRQRVEEICRKNAFSLSEEDIQNLGEVQLTDIGVFEEGVADVTELGGWEYRF
ncbi:MAG: thiamine-phosphate kinase [Thermoguttaceae bacterium]|jgi:thiamine-monophosphate kinase